VLEDGLDGEGEGDEGAEELHGEACPGHLDAHAAEPHAVAAAEVAATGTAATVAAEVAG